jgi:hypothetical protein
LPAARKTRAVVPPTFPVAPVTANIFGSPDMDESDLMRIHATPDDLTETHICHIIYDYNSSMVLAWMDGF